MDGYSNVSDLPPLAPMTPKERSAALIDEQEGWANLVAAREDGVACADRIPTDLSRAAIAKPGKHRE